MKNIDSSQTLSNTRLDSIEVLRGFAALLVIFAHVLALGGFNDIPLLYVTKASQFFGLAVPVFYAISAFSLLYGYHNKIFTEFDIKRFYIRRYFRLAPLFYVMILVWGVWMYVKFNVKYLFTDIIANCSMLFSLIPTKQESLVAGGWSIGIEWLFYLAFPLFVIIIRSRMLLIASFIISIIISTYYTSLTTGVLTASPSLNYMALLKHIIFFMAGGVAFKFMPWIELVQKKYTWLNKLDIVYLCIGIWSFRFLSKLGYIEVVEAVFFILLLLWAVVGFTRLLNNKLTRLWGKFSYSLYLLNPFIIVVLNELGLYGYVRKIIPHADLSFVVSAILTILVITGVSFITYYFIEKNGIDLGTWIINRNKSKHQITPNYPTTKSTVSLIVSRKQ